MSKLRDIFLYPRKSLRTMLTLWFLSFSVVPLFFITGYALVQFEKVYSDETLKRLNDNFIVITKTISDVKNYLKNASELHATDETLIFNLSTKNIANLKRMAADWLTSGYMDQVSLFDREGQLIVTQKKDADGFIINDVQQERGDVFLNESLLKTIEEKKEVILTDMNPSGGFDLISYAKVVGKKERAEGYIQETIHINQSYIEDLKRRFGLEVIVLNKEFKPSIATREDFLKVPGSVYDSGDLGNVKYIELDGKNEPFSILIKSFERDQDLIKIGLASSKKEIGATIKKINRAVFSVVGIVIFLILTVLWFVSKKIFGPLAQLMDAVKKLESGQSKELNAYDQQTEIGELTKRFNEMSKKVIKVQSDLTTKVKELEHTNRELQEAQAQLIHSAKMGSLGQLVAGVAHELNNPIGFIHSNVGILRDYSDKLIELVEASGKNSEGSAEEFEKLKDLFDYDYLKEDMSKLIKSCEDGSKRIRDIVLNLKNFSRSDELERKEYQLEDGIESTLEILKNEYKDRIKIHKKFGGIPPIHCYPGQINQVFMNILTNAIQAIPNKGEIWVETEKRGLEIHITIKDSGRGISTEDMDKIFDPFFTTKPVGQGTGLGLSISYGIIQKHNGRILVDSNPGQGTEFKIILPLITPKE